jgi:MFS family permease
VKAVKSTAGTISAAIVLVALVGIALSLFIPLLSLEMERQGISATLSGLNTAFGGLGTLAAVPFVPRVAARVGVTPLLLVAVIATAGVAVGFHLSPFWAWFPLRFVFGAALGAIFVLSEYWINAAAPPARRGFVMGVYATVLATGFAAGPLLLLMTGTNGAAPYLAGAAIALLALIPLLLARGITPDLAGESHVRVLPFLTAVPTATFAALVFGAIETGGFALFPVYGLRTGFSELNAAMLVSIVAAGNVVSQMPLGWLSDKMDRRVLLLLCALAGAAGCALMPVLIDNRPLFYGLLFVWGGLTGGLYTVGLAHLGARFSGLELASANAAFVMLYSIGLILGPPLVGISMDGLGAHGLGAHGFALALGLMLAMYAGLVATRLKRS